MTAGRRRNLITLQRYTVVEDEYGGETQTWADVGKEWARIHWGRGDERRSAAMEQGQQPATFVIPSNTRTRSLTVRDRIVLDGVNWDIQGTAPMTRATVEVTAVRAA